MSRTIRNKAKGRNNKVIFACPSERDKQRLQEEAKQNGRSLSKECAWRLFNGTNEKGE